MDKECPRCNDICSGEDLGDHPCFLSYSCDCGFNFSYDTYRDELYNNKGDIIKGGA